jgi:hypothetical protein
MAKPEPMKITKPQPEKTLPANVAAKKPDPKAKANQFAEPKPVAAAPNPAPVPSAAAVTSVAAVQSQAALGSSSINASQTYSGKEGEERQVAGPDGVTKRVRVIGQKP